MWKAYSSSAVRKVSSAGLSIWVAAFISAFLLSLLCGIFYNAWKYEVERVRLETGEWHSRISGELTPGEIEIIENFANVEQALKNEEEGRGAGPSVDLTFRDIRAVFRDTSRIAERLGIPPERISYNYELLALYLCRAPGDTAPRLLFPLFLLITLAASLSLIVVIHNAFALTMYGRIHQFGILASVGATPKQIRTGLLQEAAALCALPALAGNLLGIAGSAGLLGLTNILPAGEIPGRHEAVFGYHPLVLGFTVLLTAATIWISAWLPAQKLSKLTPLEAIKKTGEYRLKRRKNSFLLSFLFGIEGELAGNGVKAQKKALRTANLSFLFSFLSFSLMLCFFSLAEISTRETYFERYQDVWDIMVTVKDAEIEEWDGATGIRELNGVENAIGYQKASAKRFITEEEMSEEMRSFGGFSHVPENYVTPKNGGWLVNAPVLILDDASFLAYCEQLCISPRLDGAVLLNRIRDVTNPDFRHPVFMPYVKEGRRTSVLQCPDDPESTAEIPVLTLTDQAPPLREEYATLDYYEFVHFIPASLWREIKGLIGGAEKECYVCVKCGKNVTGEELDALQGEIASLTGDQYPLESENRIREYETNNRQITGMKVFFGGFCVLLAVIGVGNVFSNTLGFVRQRKREFARYFSVGLTPGQIKKMFCVEALTVAVRPVLAGLPVAALAVWSMLRASYMDWGEFLAEAPVIPMAVFILTVWGTVALAYALGWGSLRNLDLSEVLRDDTLL